jgi:hypothetical protein
MWDSDGEYDRPGYKASDGTIFRSPDDANKHDKERGQLPAAWRASAAPVSKTREEE